MSIQLKVGMKVRLSYWDEDFYVTVDYIGKDNFMATNKAGYESCPTIKANWIEYAPPRKKIKIDFWLNIYPNSANTTYLTEKLAKQNSAEDCLGQFHVVGEL